MSRHNLFIGLVLVSLTSMKCVTCSAFADSIGTTSHTHLTQEEAIGLAKAFCRKISVPVSMDGTAQYFVPDLSSTPQPHHWQARWDIKFGTQANVEVIDATGIVVGFQSFSDSAESSEIGKQPAGPAIPKEEAIRRATQVLKATGQTGELAFCRADIDQFSEPPTVLGHVWIISWDRQFQGVLYLHEGCNVTLNAETGEVQAMGLIFHAPPPSTARILVTEATARQKAMALLTQAGASDPQFLQSRHVMMQPNSYWQSVSPSTVGLPQTERSVWNCSYLIGADRYHVWVDTETGNVIGGEAAGPRGVDPLTSHP